MPDKRVKIQRIELCLGDLRKRITFQKPVMTPDDQGGQTTEWVDVDEDASVWAALLPISKGQQMFAEQMQQCLTHDIVCRWRDGIDTSMQVVFGDRVFQIHSVVNHKEQNFFMVLSTAEFEAS